MKTRSNGADGDSYDLRDLFVAQPLDLAQNDHDARLGGERGEHALDHHLLQDAGGGRGHRWIDLLARRVGAAKPVDADSRGDAEEVRAEVRVVPELGQFAERFEEGLLHHVLRKVGVAQEVRRHPAQTDAVEIDETLHRVRVAATRLGGPGGLALSDIDRGFHSSEPREREHPLGILAEDVTAGGEKFTEAAKFLSVHSVPMPASLPPPPLAALARPAPSFFSSILSASTSSSALRELSLDPSAPEPAADATLREAAKVAGRLYRLGKEGPDRLDVISNDAQTDLETGVTIFHGPVKAFYGFTVLYANTLVVRTAPTIPPLVRPPITIEVEGRSLTLETEQAYAFGDVRIVDPEGTVNATDLQFRYGEGVQGGTAQNVAIRVGATRVEAARMVYTPERTVLYDAFGTACRQSPPFLAVRSSQAVVIPGKRASLRYPQIQVFGQSLPAIPQVVGFSLDPRTEGVQLPSATYNRRRGEVGITAGGNRLLNHDTAQGSFFFQAYPSRRPSYGGEYFQSTLPADAPQGRLSVISDFDERFFYSWFTNVGAGEPTSEVDYLRTPRSNYGATTQFNGGASGRPAGGVGNYSKLIEGVLERGGPLGAGGYKTTFRAAAFREGLGGGGFGGLEGFGPRLSVTGDYSQILATRGRFTTLGRADGSLVAGKGVYGFFGGEAGVFYTARPGVRFGASAFAYAQAGDSGYTLDGIRYPAGFSLRTDLNSAPTKYSLLLRFNPSLKQFDREYRISQVVGCLEPLVVFREYPRSYQIGLRFRLDDISNLLQRRNIGRRTKPRSPFER